jgi:serine/threonine-protein kinase
VRLLGAAVRATHAAPGRGAVHRDIKPANISLAADGTPQVAGFGLAKRTSAGGDRTHTGIVLGAAPYGPPSKPLAGGHGQARGKAPYRALAGLTS